MGTKIKHTYSDLETNFDIPNACIQINKMHQLTIEKLLYKTRHRILAELTAIENEWFNGDYFGGSKINYDKQMELINELHEYGFVADAKACMELMGNRITELNPEMGTWFNLQKQLMGLLVNLPKIGPKINNVVIKRTSVNNSSALVTWCYNENVLNGKNKECAILMDHLIVFMQKNGYMHIIENSLNEVQMEQRFKHYEKRILKEYIQAGWEVVEL